jgi:hypothetical protein
MTNKNKNAKKQARARLPWPLKCAVCGNVTRKVCPGCQRAVHWGCQPKHDCKGWQEGGE